MMPYNLHHASMLAHAGGVKLAIYGGSLFTVIAGSRAYIYATSVSDVQSLGGILIGIITAMTGLMISAVKMRNDVRFQSLTSECERLRDEAKRAAEDRDYKIKIAKEDAELTTERAVREAKHEADVRASKLEADAESLRELCDRQQKQIDANMVNVDKVKDRVATVSIKQDMIEKRSNDPDAPMRVTVVNEDDHPIPTIAMPKSPPPQS